MSKDFNWKDYLLKSGIPLEYEILKYLETKQCQSSFGFTYLRDNENRETTEFSYDIDSSYIKPPHWIDLMIECKYRHDSTKWLFLPSEYGGPDEIEHTSFMHPNDHFNKKNKFIFDHDFPIQFAPLCTKGIEITSEGQNPKTITQGIMQLSFAISKKIIDNFYHHTDNILAKQFNGVIFFNVPIIVTTAKLYRIREKATINDIKNSDDIEAIAERKNSLVIKCKAGIELERYNYSVFQKFINGHGKQKLSQLLNTFNSDIDFVMSVIAKHFSPSCIIVLEHNEKNESFEKLFQYMDLVIRPTDAIFEMIIKRKKEIQKVFKNIKKRKINTH